MLGPVLSTLCVITHLTQQKLYEIVIVIIPLLQMRNWGTVFFKVTKPGSLPQVHEAVESSYHKKNFWILTIGKWTASQALSHLIHTWTLSVQFSSVAQSCPTLCNPMNSSTPGLPVQHQLPESTQTHFHWVSDANQPSHPLSSPFPPTLNLSQHQGLFQWVSSSHQVAKVLKFQLQHKSFQWTPGLISFTMDW